MQLYINGGDGGGGGGRKEKEGCKIIQHTSY